MSPTTVVTLVILAAIVGFFVGCYVCLSIQDFRDDD